MSDPRHGPFRVCLDLTPLEMWDRHGGIGRYCVHLLEEILALPPSARAGLSLVAMTSTTEPPIPAERALEALSHLPPEVPIEEHWRRRRSSMGALLRKSGADLLHSTVPGVLPERPGCRVVSTIYDLIPLIMPNRTGSFLHKWREERKDQKRFRRTYAAVDHAIAISARTKQDMVELLGMPGEAVSVVHLGVDTRAFSSEPEAPDERARTIGKHGLPERWLVSVGSDHYRKNHERLLEAWCSVANRIPEGLVFVGRPLYADTLQRIEQLVAERGLSARFRWLRDLDDDALPALYRHATAAVAPSLYEGFGMTLLEAMACGAPVAAARNGAYEEVAGPDAIYFDPLRVPDVAAALERLCTDAGLRADLRARGLVRARRATWSRMAAETLTVYRRVLAEPRFRGIARSLANGRIP